MFNLPLLSRDLQSFSPGAIHYKHTRLLLLLLLPITCA
jgi:hypothetical protein